MWVNERTSYTQICQYDFISALHNNPEFPRATLTGALNSSWSTLIFLTGDVCISPQEIQFQLLERNETSLREKPEWLTCRLSAEVSGRMNSRLLFIQSTRLESLPQSWCAKLVKIVNMSIIVVLFGWFLNQIDSMRHLFITFKRAKTDDLPAIEDPNAFHIHIDLKVMQAAY